MQRSHFAAEELSAAREEWRDLSAGMAAQAALARKNDLERQKIELDAREYEAWIYRAPNARFLLGRVRFRTIQGVLDAGYVDAFRALQPDHIGYTFPTSDPHVRLDYLFVPGPCVERVSRCQVFSANEVCEASDHFPLIAELN